MIGPTLDDSEVPGPPDRNELIRYTEGLNFRVGATPRDLNEDGAGKLFGPSPMPDS